MQGSDGGAPNEFQLLARVVFPILIALVLLLVGGALVALLATPGEGVSPWIWPAALLGFVLLAWLFRSRLSHWISPAIFLMAAVPVLVLLTALYVLIPHIPVGGPVLAEESVNSSLPLDLEAELMTLEGRKVSLADEAGNVLFLNFWATWCGPCRQEMPSMDDLYQKFSSQGLSMVAVTDEDPETVRAYLEKMPYTFTVLLDPSGALFSRLKIRALPTTLVLDEERKVLIEHEGGYQWNTPELVEKFRKMLAR